jgi:putative membrane protein
MDIPQNRSGAGRLLIVVLVAAALGSCATSRKQPPATNANANVAAAPQAAPPIAKEGKARRAVNPAAPARVASSKPALTSSNKTNAAAIFEQIHQANLREIAIGKMASGKASSSEVRAYADQLVQDHTNADQMVAATAQKVGAHLHDAAGSGEGRHESAHGERVEQKLSSATGAGFDRLFLQQTSSDQQGLIRSLQQEREDASNDDIEALIDKIIPILEQHRDLAEILMKKERAQAARSGP